MNTDLRAATRDATRALLDYASVFSWFWSILIVVFAIVLTARASTAEVDTSTWLWMGSSPKIFALVIGILLPTLALPRWVSHGITRRAFTFAADIIVGAIAIMGAALVAVGYAAESVVYRAVGLQDALDDLPLRLFADSSAWYLIVVQYALLFGAYAITGWLIGAGYYRWGALRGTLFLIPAALPLVATEAILVGQPLADELGLERLPVPAMIAAVLAITVLGGIAGYHVVKNMALRRTAGWTI
jgi:hypothetical protein